MRRYVFLCFLALLSACSLSNRVSASHPKNIILVIGDGMGPQQLALAEIYNQRSGKPEAAPLDQYMRSSTIGAHLPLAADVLVNDSACSATEMSSGCLCQPRQVGLDASGGECKGIVARAHDRGMLTALVSDTAMTHATPAGFGAHVTHRKLEDEIARQLANSSIDILLSGGSGIFRATRGAGEAPTVLDEARKRGYHVVTTRDELDRAVSAPILGLFSEKLMANAFHEGEGNEPTLRQMTKRTLDLLSASSGSDGFFAMIEAGQIDIAAHQNDAGWMLREMLRLSSVMEEIDSFVKIHPDTLVVLTGDHETGGFGFSYHSVPAGQPPAHAGGATTMMAGELDFIGDRYLYTLMNQRNSIGDVIRAFRARPRHERTVEELIERLREDIGVLLTPEQGQEIVVRLGCEEERSISSECGEDASHSHSTGSAARRLSALARKAQGVVWATGNHTSTPVFIMSKGPGSERFGTFMTTVEFGSLLNTFVAAD